MRRALITFALVAAPLALVPALAEEPRKEASKAQTGLFIRQGETRIFTLADGQPVESRGANRDDKPGNDELMVTLNGGMMQIVNGTDRPYNYRAFIARSPSDKGQRTSVCTLMPKVPVFESWGGSLPGIRLTDFKPAGSRMICA